MRRTESRRAAKASLLIAADEGFTRILAAREGSELRCIGESFDIALTPRTRYYVQVSVKGDSGDSASAVSFFETGKMDEPFSAAWIGTQPEDRFHPLFFRAFTLREKPVSARLYITGLGLYEAYLGGEKVGDEYLAPDCNDYNEGVQVQTYDVTGLLHAGENLFEIACGNGWYKGRLGYEGGSEVYGDRFMALAELHIRFADGHELVCGTDESWHYRASDFAMSDIYDGECLDRTSLGREGKPGKARRRARRAQNRRPLQPARDYQGHAAGQRSNPHPRRGVGAGLRAELHGLCVLHRGLPRRDEDHPRPRARSCKTAISTTTTTARPGRR